MTTAGAGGSVGGMAGTGGTSAGAAGAGAGGSAGGAAGAAGGSATGAGGAGGVVTLPTPCPNPIETEPGSGTVRCDNGLVHRPTPGTCPAYVPNTDVIPASRFPNGDECFTDAECSERALGYCKPAALTFFGNPNPSNICVYACTTDADCESGSICQCDATRGYCREADCVTDDSCPADAFCALNPPGCGYPTFSCQSADDECAVDADCGAANECTQFSGQPRRCALAGCPG